MSINKVIYDGRTLIDLSADTVSADKVAAGIKFHDKTGAVLTGENTFDADTGDGTANATEILTGQVAYVNGNKVVGEMANNGSKNITIANKNQEIAVPMGFHDGGGKVSVDPTEKAKLVPANIKAGITVMGVTGGYSGESVTAQSKTVTPSAVQQTVLPDEGTDYLAQVTVEKIPYNEAPNPAGGMTVTIG